MANKAARKEFQKKQQEKEEFVRRRLKLSPQLDVARPQANKFTDLFLPYQAYFLNNPNDWVNRLRTRSHERALLDLVKYTFYKYKTPRHLNLSWIIKSENNRPVFRLHSIDFRLWSILVAQGVSLFKHPTNPGLSRGEIHQFMNYRHASAKQAVWYALAKTYTDDSSKAIKIAHTKVVAMENATPWDKFWREVIVFFSHNSLSIESMNDVLDWIFAQCAENPNFSMKGRSLASVQKRMEEWHRDLYKQSQLQGRNWTGYPIVDKTYESEDGKARWHFNQITTGDELFAEGKAMHHCVLAYKHSCLSGHCGIFSLKCEFPLGTKVRSLTLEVRRTSDGYRLSQAKGFANRGPAGGEWPTLRVWCRDNNIDWSSL